MHRKRDGVMSTLHERRATATAALVNRRVRVTADLRAQLSGEIDLPMNTHGSLRQHDTFQSTSYHSHSSRVSSRQFLVQSTD